MARLIDYQAAVDRYYTEFEKQDICDGAQDRDWLKQCFDEAPTIDPKSLRLVGRWVHLGGDEWRCSSCSEVVTTEGSWERPTYKYCHSCGARMEETE